MPRPPSAVTATAAPTTTATGPAGAQGPDARGDRLDGGLGGRRHGERETTDHVFEALRAGAAGFLVEDVLPEDFLHAVRVAARGDALLAPSITRGLIDRYVSEPFGTGPGAGLEELTNREREAVALVARGLSNDEIADRMVITPMTAKTHVNRAMMKIGARDRAQLVVLAYESGLVAPRAPGR
ncbi:helix-turn-helix transcriptional regulator [Streptomyces litmocidini]|uniref:helix-turn-helix transcriptional regulator n=1 Tax=Streptomyces litmocidini TaxID=67318 RepID=UPI0036FEB57E